MLLCAALAMLDGVQALIGHAIRRSRIIVSAQSVSAMRDQPDPMVVIPAGNYRVGSESFYPEESPVRPLMWRHLRSMWHRSPMPNLPASLLIPATA